MSCGREGAATAASPNIFEVLDDSRTSDPLAIPPRKTPADDDGNDDDDDSPNRSSPSMAAIGGSNWRCSEQQAVDYVRARSCYTYRFKVEMGNEREMMWVAPAGAREIARHNFVGCCYHCGQPGHSQNFCPLRMCRHCAAWGHTDKCCPLLEQQRRRGSPTPPRRRGRQHRSVVGSWPPPSERPNHLQRGGARHHRGV